MKYERARFWDQKQESTVKCELCSRECVIKPGGVGFCGVRQNQDGELKTLNYHCLCSANADKIEKKPLNHFLPSTSSFSICAPGCNFRCKFCQNWQISQINQQLLERTSKVCPEDIAESAIKHNCKSISYTYTEPTIFYELAEDTALAAREKGLKNVFVTNGYMKPQVWEKASGWLDAANIDLKANTEDFYRDFCSATLAPVKESIKLALKLGIWIELTTLLIPGLNDSDEEIHSIAEFIAGEVSEFVPLHLSAFYPCAEMKDTPAQTPERIQKACEIARDTGLKYVYPGNVMLDSNTYCHNCGRLIISRSGFSADPDGVIKGKCELCGAEIPGVFE
ncbi:AmmeMemoRadiSam system radical SAM enzyme [Sedimentisphaera salicampi]|uniref:AmmeMemoRadiSam system radical SAM enzyme n=1 Tax=Sedimentisphaera salicampi TaxID=1941349 RepID=UPI000B9A2B53|nr:AmmeMemoRadiSam system radical SAM enzyme [Sedimentisphaera salicampi]OXU14132.1 molybdenum cofactor biosynthesis protein A [Sedimentisphaera salicampi]